MKCHIIQSDVLTEFHSRRHQFCCRSLCFCKHSRNRALSILVKIVGNFGSVENGKRFVGSSCWKIPGKSGKSKKVGPFSRLELSERNFVCHYFTRFSYFIPVSIVTNSAAILVSHRVTGSALLRGLRSNGTTFYLSENPFLFPQKFPDFLPEWKALTLHFPYMKDKVSQTF